MRRSRNLLLHAGTKGFPMPLHGHDKYQPGELAPEDGEYEVIGATGAPVGVREDLRKGEPFPKLPGGFTWRRTAQPWRC